jgi:hypothetical protein
MIAKVVDLAPHEWCEISASTEIRPGPAAQRTNGWTFRCAVAVVSASLGFYISTAAGGWAPILSAKRGTVPVVSAHAPFTSIRAASRHASPRDWAKNHSSTAARVETGESEKTRWEMAGWAVRR